MSSRGSGKKCGDRQQPICCGGPHGDWRATQPTPQSLTQHIAGPLRACLPGRAWLVGFCCVQPQGFLPISRHTRVSYLEESMTVHASRPIHTHGCLEASCFVKNGVFTPRLYSHARGGESANHSPSLCYSLLCPLHRNNCKPVFAPTPQVFLLSLQRN